MNTFSKQENSAISYMKENGSATVRELFIYCNINSPTKVISKLWKKGLIEKQDDSRVKSNGETVRFKRYFLKGEDNAD